jgi:hypothetical protein
MDALGEKSIHVLTSNWWGEANYVAKQLAQSSSMNAKTGFLNQAVTALSPVLVHGFRKTVCILSPLYIRCLLSINTRGKSG